MSRCLPPTNVQLSFMKFSIGLDKCMSHCLILFIFVRIETSSILHVMHCEMDKFLQSWFLPQEHQLYMHQDRFESEWSLHVKCSTARIIADYTIWSLIFTIMHIDLAKRLVSMTTIHGKMGSTRYQLRIWTMWWTYIKLSQMYKNIILHTVGIMKVLLKIEERKKEKGRVRWQREWTPRDDGLGGWLVSS